MGKESLKDAVAKDRENQSARQAASGLEKNNDKLQEAQEEGVEVSSYKMPDDVSSLFSDAVAGIENELNKNSILAYDALSIFSNTAATGKESLSLLETNNKSVYEEKKKALNKVFQDAINAAKQAYPKMDLGKNPWAPLWSDMHMSDSEYNALSKEAKAAMWQQYDSFTQKYSSALAEEVKVHKSFEPEFTKLDEEYATYTKAVKKEAVELDA
ncbi:MAG: hypothetical protein NTZ48_03640, partial [Candidatus Omnitrophica bacterium]|nr:hypothetical protein [Candidatus Omnitrophota bacterium]